MKSSLWLTKMIMAKLETTIHSLHCIAGNSGHQDTRINVLDTNNTVKCDFWPKSFCRPWWIQKERSGQGIKLYFDLLAQKLDLDGFSSWKWSKKNLIFQVNGDNVTLSATPWTIPRTGAEAIITRVIFQFSMKLTRNPDMTLDTLWIIYAISPPSPPLSASKSFWLITSLGSLNSK